MRHGANVVYHVRVSILWGSLDMFFESRAAEKNEVLNPAVRVTVSSTIVSACASAEGCSRRTTNNNLPRILRKEKAVFQSVLIDAGRCLMKCRQPTHETHPAPTTARRRARVLCVLCFPCVLCVVGLHSMRSMRSMRGGIIIYM